MKTKGKAKKGSKKSPKEIIGIKFVIDSREISRKKLDKVVVGVGRRVNKKSKVNKLSHIATVITEGEYSVSFSCFMKKDVNEGPAKPIRQMISYFNEKVGKGSKPGYKNLIIS